MRTLLDADERVAGDVPYHQRCGWKQRRGDGRDRAGVVAISVVESAVIEVLLPGGTPGFWHMLLFIATMNGIQFGWLLVSLLLLRAAGYRLVGAR